MSISRLIAAAVVAATATTFLAATPAAANVKVGSLGCDISAGFGVIIGSKRTLNCIFTPSSQGWPSERYTGTITKLGVDVGALAGGGLIWLVYAPTNRLDGALQGSYNGVAANATVGIGVGANVLIGGFEGSVALQPVSAEGTSGLNVAAGVANMILTWVPPIPPPPAPKRHVSHR
ncbi:DUF992 domain-containing protein [Rhizobium sp. P32RR-XVIII]|uniref:DUF992 domain-containing protein n=1 Tax=Rhizobium sp. P32RR-XVIII TaxID=2726738 RepID=UPI0014568F2D|nr:DUF992 domain-containing protein [Rhizobium sp. P32RR-XVIII]NLS08378.1 DUF992 domain-containing protein [Rhizobium sp. P32RR-XVIII]